MWRWKLWGEKSQFFFYFVMLIQLHVQNSVSVYLNFKLHLSFEFTRLYLKLKSNKKKNLCAKSGTNTDKGRGHSCCLQSHCGHRHWRTVPRRCPRVSTASLDWCHLRYPWAFSVWVWLECIQFPASHTLHLQHKRQFVKPTMFLFILIWNI